MSSNITCKQILVVGEGPFLFTESLVNKYCDRIPYLPKAITATELICNHPEETKNRIERLKKLGVRVLLNVDATRLHEHPDLANSRFKRIEWVCPHAGLKTSTVVADFFSSAKRLQKPGDQIRIVLAQGKDERGNVYEEWRQHVVYGIVSAVSSVNYALVEKRDFNSQRYPGYEHRQSGKDIPAAAALDKSIEFIFQKRIEKESLEKAIFLLSSVKHEGLKPKFLRIISELSPLLEFEFSTKPLPSQLINVLLSIKEKLDELTKEAQALPRYPKLEEDPELQAINKIINKIRKIISLPKEIQPQRKGNNMFFPDLKELHNRYPKADHYEDNFLSETEYYDSDSEMETEISSCASAATKTVAGS